LSRLDQRAQQLLLRTSVVDRLTPELAVFLSDDSDVNTHLAELIRSGLFAVELQTHTAYHYHSLFATLLRARLRQRDPRLALDLHRRAAEWYAANDMPVDAEEHARLAHEWLMLGNLVGRRWLGATLEGRPLRPDPLAEVPTTVVRRTPGLALVAAAEACARQDREAADVYRAAAGPPPADPSAGLADQTAAVRRAVLDVAHACAFGADDSTAGALDVLRVPPGFESAAPELQHRFAVLRGAELALDAGAFDDSQRALLELSDSGETSWTTVEASGFLALQRSTAARLDEAEHLAQSVLAAEHLARPVAAHAARLATVLCAAQRGEERRAAETLTKADPAAALPSRCLRRVDRALRAGLHGGALLSVGLDAETAAHPLVERVLVALGVLEVINGDGHRAALGGLAEDAVRLARQRLASGAYDGLSQAVAGCSHPLTVGSAHPRTLIEAAALGAVASYARGDRRAVLASLREALELAAATGIRAPLLHLPALAPALRLYAGDLGGEQGSALELLDRISHSNGRVSVEALTEREITVLRYLPTLMSNAEMAGAMHLSVNTVKTHLKAVYRKLGVDGRRHAVVRGRELELL
jgi:LuxR family maltose regulon positive regulatory protein